MDMQKRRRGRRPWQPVAVRGAARLRGRIWNPPLRALCSKVFLRSYCSTPPLKRKIKFFFKLCRLFQHRRRFFRRRTGLLSGAHFLPEWGGGGWNPQHSFLQAVLLSAAQFAGQPLLYRLLSRTQFRGGGVGIPRTVCGGRGCYRQHNFCAVRSAGQKIPVVIGRTIPTLSAGGRLLSTAQFARCGKLIIVIGSTIRILGGFPKVSKPGCYPAHISVSGVVIERTVSKL